MHQGVGLQDLKFASGFRCFYLSGGTFKTVTVLGSWNHLYENAMRHFLKCGFLDPH